VYLSIKMGAPAPFELWRWHLAERFHWTLAEVDNLSLADWHELIQIDDGRAKARNNGN
jgi:hypothetical protein